MNSGNKESHLVEVPNNSAIIVGRRLERSSIAVSKCKYAWRAEQYICGGGDLFTVFAGSREAAETPTQ